MKIKLHKSNVCRCQCHLIGIMGEHYCDCCKLMGQQYISKDNTIDEDLYVRLVLDNMAKYRKEFKKRFSIEI
ncbi:MAG: hypothetical protein MJZ34_08030 [Paludibacteraceae bacterium]|nr:hypothetical protein [Paludibacteraceae bacterium]